MDIFVIHKISNYTCSLASPVPILNAHLGHFYALTCNTTVSGLMNIYRQLVSVKYIDSGMFCLIFPCFIFFVDKRKMADPPPPYPGTDQGESYPSGDTTKQPIPPDGSAAPEYPPQLTPGYPPVAGYISQPGQLGYPLAQFNASCFE